LTEPRAPPSLERPIGPRWLMSALYESRPGGFDICPASQAVATPITDIIHLSQGLSNAWLVVTGEGRVVINTGMGFEAAVHKRNFDAVSRAPVRAILLTQGHVDHVGGVDVFREPDTEVIAHAAIRRQQEDDARLRALRAARSGFAFAETVTRGIRAVAEQFGRIPAQAVAEPTTVFTDRYDFGLGGIRFELLSTPGGETADSMVVWLPEHGACFCGNLFGALFGHFPNLVTIRGDRYRDALLFVESLDRVRALDADLLLVGHHEPVRGRSVIRAELDRLRASVLYVHDQTVRGMNAGKDVFTLMREVSLPADLRVGEGYGKVSWGVRAIFENYTGWFHHRSTAELYALSPECVYGDLVALAGGTDAIAARAAARMEAGEHVEALHLLDVALGVEPTNRRALGVAFEAHEALAAKSRNFWLTSWLRHRLASLRGALDATSREIRITDLAAPELDREQVAALAAAEGVPVDFDEDAILAQARERAGLDDFGPEDFRRRLRLLAEEWEGDRGLTHLARIGLRENLVRYATNRLLIRNAWVRDPAILDREIRRPLIVAGLPRTGTTHLVNLLAADRRFRSLPLWEAYEPLPRPDEQPTGDVTDSRYQRCAESWSAMRRVTPLLEAMHPMHPDHVHEELELMTPDFASYNFEWLSMSPRWRDDYYAHDQTPHYRYLKNVLKLLQRPDGPDRWVLKCPQHLEQLPVLADVFPDAFVVFTHRDPVAALQSILTMLAYGQRANRKRVEIHALAEYWVARVEHLLRACVRDRDVIPSNRSLDVRFEDFMADEMGTVERIYRAAGVELTVDTRLALDRFREANRRGKYGRVHYDLEADFRLLPGDLHARFSFYLNRFGVRTEL
jgi:glyoxylase-like metal-dependent hydrolase (beta-lactamase superfamily II)